LAKFVAANKDESNKSNQQLQKRVGPYNWPKINRRGSEGWKLKLWCASTNSFPCFKNPIKILVEMPLKIRVVLSTSKESKISGNRNICPEDLDARGMAGLAQIESFETDEKPKSGLLVRLAICCLFTGQLFINCDETGCGEN